MRAVSSSALQNLLPSLTHTEASFRVEDSDWDPAFFLVPPAPPGAIHPRPGLQQHLPLVQRRPAALGSDQRQAWALGGCWEQRGHWLLLQPLICSHTFLRVKELFSTPRTLRAKDLQGCPGVTAFCGIQGLWGSASCLFFFFFASEDFSEA